jgi:acyl carrier protein
MEKFIAEAWCEDLGVDCVGVQDNFFDLGGHSLLLVKVISRIEEKIGQRIHPSAMVYQTLGQLAAACEQRMLVSQASASKQLRRRWVDAIKKMFN